MKKTQQIKDLRTKDKKALFSELDSLNKKLVELRTDVTFRKLKNFHQISQTRHQIARVWTILTEKTILETEKNEVVK